MKYNMRHFSVATQEYLFPFVMNKCVKKLNIWYHVIDWNVVVNTFAAEKWY